MMHAAARFEVKHNKGKWCSFEEWLTGGRRFSNRVPEHLKVLFNKKEQAKFGAMKERAKM